jgi:hypothetical protein
MAVQRSLLRAALDGDEATVAGMLQEEQTRERPADRDYWGPLKLRLEQLRLNRGHM